MYQELKGPYKRQEDVYAQLPGGVPAPPPRRQSDYVDVDRREELYAVIRDESVELISRQESEELLRRAGFNEGSYVVRRSQTHPDCFVLVLVAAGVCHHYPLERANGSLCVVFAGAQRFFTTLGGLLDYYTEHHDLVTKLTTRIRSTAK